MPTPPAATCRWNSTSWSLTSAPGVMCSKVADLMTRLRSCTGPSRAGASASGVGAVGTRKCLSVREEGEVLGVRRAQHGPVVDQPPRAGHHRPALAVAVVAVDLRPGMRPHRLVERLVDAAVVLLERLPGDVHGGVVVLEQVLQAFDDVVDLLLAGEVVPGAVVRRGVGPGGDEQIRE